MDKTKEQEYKPQQGDWTQSTEDKAIRLYDEFMAKVEVEVHEATLNNATPPIKGELTAGKIKWRGICVVTNEDNDHWVEQRGKRISKIIKFPRFITNQLK